MHAMQESRSLSYLHGKGNGKHMSAAAADAWAAAGC